MNFPRQDANTPFGLLLGLLLLLAPAWAAARNLDLSTVPARGSVQLTIYNSEDLTLVRETRRVSFKQGVNPLQFSWANTLIDPTSVELRFPAAADRLTILDATFPHDKPQMLYWNVEASEGLEAEIEISYFTSGIHWSADYVAIADPQETTLALEGFVRVHNQSGEDYEEASVRLVVGEINLVEKIAELARMPQDRLKDLGKEEYRGLRAQAARKVMAAPPAPAPMVEMAAGAGMAEPKAVEKQGLGEYFIYTIEGTETIPNGWSKRLRSFEAASVPMQVEYRYRPQEYGDQLVRLYLMKNDKASHLGETPIPDGQIRVLRRKAGAGGGSDKGAGPVETLAYLASQSIRYVPIGDKLELNLGRDPEVVFDLVESRVARDNIWMLVKKGRTYERVDDGKFQVDPNSSVAGWDEHQLYTQRVRNYTDRPIRVEVRRSFDGDVLFRSRLGAELHDYRTVQYKAEIAPGERKELPYEVITRNGRNAKQYRVELGQD